MPFGYAISGEPDEICIVVNPRQLTSDVRTSLERDRRVMIFDDLELFERWKSRCSSPGDLACEVAGVLRDVGHDRGHLPRAIAQPIERLARRPITPTVREFLKNEHSERTFYRRWNEILPLRPKEFLDRVRFLHALRLIEQHGYSLKEAAAVAGYGCADRLRADARRHSARAA